MNLNSPRHERICRHLWPLALCIVAGCLLCGCRTHRKVVDDQSTQVTATATAADTTVRVVRADTMSVVASDTTASAGELRRRVLLELDTVGNLLRADIDECWHWVDLSGSASASSLSISRDSTFTASKRDTSARSETTTRRDDEKTAESSPFLNIPSWLLITGFIMFLLAFNPWSNNRKQ